MFSCQKSQDRDPKNFSVQGILTVGEQIKTERIVACKAIVEGQLLVTGDLTADIDGQCVNLLQDTMAIHGTILGADGTPDTVRFASFGQAGFSTATVPAVKIPYAAQVVGFAVQYMHSDTAFTSSEGGQIDFTIAAIPAGSAHSAANYEANKISADPLISFTEADDDTHPSKSATGLSLVVPAGSQLAVRAELDGDVGSDEADYNVVLFVRAIAA